jgi:hypothetical protein
MSDGLNAWRSLPRERRERKELTKAKIILAPPSLAEYPLGTFILKFV